MLDNLERSLTAYLFSRYTMLLYLLMSFGMFNILFVELDGLTLVFASSKLYLLFQIIVSLVLTSAIVYGLPIVFLALLCMRGV